MRHPPNGPSADLKHLDLSLSIGAADDVHQFLDLAALISLVPRFNRMIDAIRDVVTKYFLFDPPQSGTYGSDLRYDVNAISVLFDHTRQAPHLTFDAGETLGA